MHWPLGLEQWHQLNAAVQFGSCETAGRHSTVVTVCGAVVLEQPACAACSCYAVDEPVTQ